MLSLLGIRLKMPTVGAFAKLLQESKHHVLMRILEIEGEHGPVLLIRLVRKVDGKVLTSQALPRDQNEIMTVDLCRALLAQLQLKPADVGLSLTWIPPDKDLSDDEPTPHR